MSLLSTYPAVTATAGTPTPIYTGTVTSAISFVIAGGLATITMASLPSGYALGKQVTLWGFTTATYFNGEVVTIVAVNPVTFSFSFATTHANVSPTADAGKTSPVPFQKYRGVRIEADAGNGEHVIYVGDKNVSSTRYTTVLGIGTTSPPTALHYIWVGGEGNLAMDIAPSRIFVDTDSTGSKAQITLVY